MKYENLGYLIVGICIGVLASLLLFCGNHIIVTEADISFLIKDFVKIYKNIPNIQFIINRPKNTNAKSESK